MRKCAALLSTIASISFLSGCGRPEAPPVVTTVNTLCVTVPVYHFTDAQRAAFKADPSVWEPLVDWVSSIFLERKKQCGSPTFGGPR